MFLGYILFGPLATLIHVGIVSVIHEEKLWLNSKCDDYFLVLTNMMKGKHMNGYYNLMTSP